MIALYQSAESIGVRPSARAVLDFARALGLRFRNEDAYRWLRPFVNAGSTPGAPGSVRERAIKEEGAEGNEREHPGSAFVRANKVSLVSKTPTGGTPCAPAREDRAFAPGREFAAWFLESAVASNVLGEHLLLDRDAWVYGQLGHANDLVVAYGVALCQEKALAFFRAYADRKIRRPVSIDALKAVWSFRELTPMRAVSEVGGDEPDWLRQVRAAEAGGAR